MNAVNSFGLARTAILSINPEDLARRADLGNQLAFVGPPKFMAGIQRLINSISDEAYSYVPDQILADIAANFGAIGNLVEQISAFRVEQGPNQRQNIEEQFANLYAAVFHPLTEVLANSIAFSQNNLITQRAAEMKVSFDSKLAELDAAREAVPSLLDAVRKDAAAMEKLLEETRTRAAETVSAQDAKYFSGSASSYAKSASKWLFITVCALVVLLILSCVALAIAMDKNYAGMQPSQAAQIIVGKLVILGVVGYFANLGARNYFAAKHNEAVNRHRENAISSYRALVEATGSPEHRDIILTQAAAAVFAPQDTAYVKGAPMASDLPATIINNLPKALTGS